MEVLEKIIDEIGIEEAAKQIESFFLYKEKRYRERALEQRQKILLEQKAMRYRWRARSTGGQRFALSFLYGSFFN